jgi:hypothetical protein
LKEEDKRHLCGKNLFKSKAKEIEPLFETSKTTSYNHFQQRRPYRDGK